MVNKELIESEAGKGGRVQIAETDVVLPHGLNYPVDHEESTKPFKNKSGMVT